METNTSKIKVGLIGAGFIADWHLSALKKMHEISIEGIFDKNPSAAKHCANKHCIPFYTDNIDALLSKSDAIHILVPPQAHHDLASCILSRKKHVFLEKPMAVSEKQCAELAALAKNNQVSLGVSHNFLFFEPYAALLSDIHQKILGPISHIEIVWNKEFRPITSGPHLPWLFEAPENVLLEVGSHSIAHLLHLLGTPDEYRLETSNSLNISNLGDACRQWNLYARKGKTTASVRLCLLPCMSEHLIKVYGRVANATVDFENNRYLLQKHTPYPDDFDKFMMAKSEAKSIKRQSRRNLLNYALSKCGLSTKGNAFGGSIAESIRTFYSRLGEPGQDFRISPAFGAEVIRFCEKICEHLPSGPPLLESTRPPRAISPEVLVIGGSGFIGQELVKQLTAAHYSVRILCRNPRSLSAFQNDPQIELVQGDVRSSGDLKKAMQGVRFVYHLAKAQANTWDEFYQNDVLVTQNIAELCLKYHIEKLIYTGSIAAYYSGKKAGVIDEKTPLEQNLRSSHYARAKAASESILLHMHRTRALPVIIFRPGIVLGEGSSPFHPGIGAWISNSVCQFYGDGLNPLPTVLVGDVAKALIEALKAPNILGESFNLIGDIRPSAKEYLSQLSEVAETQFSAYQTPIWKFYSLEALKWIVKMVTRYPDPTLPLYRDIESRTQKAHYDASKAKERLGWKPCADRDIFFQKAIKEPAKTWMR